MPNSVAILSVTLLVGGVTPKLAAQSVQGQSPDSQAAPAQELPTRLVACSRRPICRSSSTSFSLTTLRPASDRPWCLSYQRGLFRMGSPGVAAASLSPALSVSGDRRGLVQQARRDNQAALRPRFGPGSTSLYGRSGSSRALVAAQLGVAWARMVSGHSAGRSNSQGYFPK